MVKYILYIPSQNVYLTEACYNGHWDRDVSKAITFSTKSQAKRLRDKYWDACLGVQVISIQEK